MEGFEVSSTHIGFRIRLQYLYTQVMHCNFIKAEVRCGLGTVSLLIRVHQFTARSLGFRVHDQIPKVFLLSQLKLTLP